MKRNLFALSLAAAALACLAGLDYSDIVKWGLVRRADVAALHPAEGYTMTVTTNVTPAYQWHLSGSFYVPGGEEPQLWANFGSDPGTEIVGLPKVLQPVEAGGLVRVDGESSFGVGFLTDGDTTLGVGVFEMVDPFVAPGCYAIGEAPPYLFDMEVGGALAGNVMLTRTDLPDVVTVTTNYHATGGGVILRDSANPRKSVRLVNGSLLLLEEIPAHWEFQGVPCFGLSYPLTSFSGTLAGYTWATETAGDPPYLYYALYDENSTRQFASDAFSGVTVSLSFYPDFEPFEVAPMIYVGPSVATNAL